MKPKKTECRREHGVALITTVIVVAVLAVVAVAMMQTTTVDRLSSRSVANSYRARLAADAGAVLAKGMVADLFARYPDSVTGWQNIGGGDVNGTNNEATVFYMRALAKNTSAGATPSTPAAEIVFLAQPLISRVTTNGRQDALETNPVAISNVTALFPYVAGSTTDAIDLNATTAARPDPFIGSRSSYKPGNPITAAQWVYMTKDGEPSSASNPYIARFAFWMEDESFKVNVNIASDGSRGPNSLGTNASDARLMGAFTNSSVTTINSMNVETVVSVRTNLPGGVFPSAATLGLAGNVDASGAGELRFLTTCHSAGLDFSRGGFRRFPLSRATFQADSAATGADGLKRFVAAITNGFACPDFGQRFYKSTVDASAAGFVSELNSNRVTSPGHRDLYLLRLAANVKDQLDDDDAPTIVTVTKTNVESAGLWDNKTCTTPQNAYAIEPDGGGTLGAPTVGGSRVAAIGKENVARLQEYAIHGRVNKMEPQGYNTNAVGSGSGAEFEIAIDHYLEFWNMGTTPINLSGCFIKIYDMPVMDLGGGSSRPDLTDPSRSVTLRIDSGSIPAGACVVVTSAPAAEINKDLCPTPNIISATVENGARVFTGNTLNSYTSTKATNSSGTVFDRAYVIKTTYRSGSVGSSVADFGTTMVMGNATNGYLDSFVGLPISRSGNSASFDLDARHFERTRVSGSPNQNNFYARAGSLMGNLSATWNNSATTAAGFGDPLAAVGDPRTLNEALEMLIYQVSSTTPSRVEQSRFLDASISDPATFPAANVTLGSVNANYVDITKWPDCSDASNNFIINTNLRTIGDLGFVFDPVRFKGDSSTVDRVRGGGRTLRIGQSELYNQTNNRSGLWDGTQTNASRNRVAWRLADIFTTNTNPACTSIAGLINPNGALRDGGAAMKAALFGMTLMAPPAGSPIPVAGRAINLSNIITANASNSPGLICRLTNTNRWIPGAFNPLWERGEISELGGSYAFSNFVATLNPQSVFDRSREEIVRRSIDMITTRGSIFSVYVVGQALQVSSGVTNVLSTARLKQTFEILPVCPPGATNDLFSPPGGTAARFEPVTNFTTRVLRNFYD